jgi:hypothetical protein
MNHVTSMLECFLPITLEATIEQASLQRRVDTKYLTDDVTVRNLLIELADSFRVLEIEGRRTFRYRSEYLDSPGRDAYKCRVRNYVDSGECHVEVKLKGSRGETVKYRAPYGDDQTTGDCADFLAACVDDAYGLRVDRRLRQVLEVEYRRITLVSLASPERVTLDNGLSFRDLATQRGRALSDTQWIVETKSPRGQGYADARLRAAHVRPVNLSKYVLGIALTDPEIRVNEYAGLIRSLDVGALMVGRSRHLAAA